MPSLTHLSEACVYSPFPVRWPQQYHKFALSLGPENSVLRMGTFHPSETTPDPDALPDPTGDQRLRPLPWVVRKHRDRVVVLAASRCFFHCRFCFRRGETRGRPNGPEPSQWEEILAWLRSRPEIKEVILSGGDPLTLPDRCLATIGRALDKIPHLERWRIHTRAPVVLPARISAKLAAALQTRLPLRVVTHANHPAEIRPTFVRAVQALRANGIPVLNQSVLLAEVNDAAATLAELFRRLAEARVQPLYLHHPDRAPGNSRFRLPLSKGRQIYRDLVRVTRRCTSDGTPPPYVIDLPNGAGKCSVEHLKPVGEEREPERRRLRYRWVRPSGWESLVDDRRYEWWDIWQSPGRHSPF